MKPKILAGGGLVWNENNDLLMIFRRNVWDLPKGKLDKGETIEECAVREVKEETGLRHIELGKLIDVTSHEYFDKWLLTDVVKETHWFMMYATANQKLVPQTHEDIVDVKWISKKTLPEYLKNTYPNILEIIEKHDQQQANK